MILDMLNYFDVINTLQIDIAKMKTFIYLVRTSYRKNYYHNFEHAFDVTQAAFSLITTYSLHKHFTPLDIAALLIACLCHDVDHPGMNNHFEINSQTDLASTYNDLSVLENHHCAFTFRLMRKNPEANILSALSPINYRTLRQAVVGMILATDMANHFEFVNKFKHVMVNGEWKETKHKQLLLNIIIKLSDLSNVAKPWNLCKRWSESIANEFFEQADMEKNKGLPVQPFMDRNQTTQPKISSDFVDFVAGGMFQVFSDFVQDDTLCKLVTENRGNWDQYLAPKDRKYSK